MMEDRERVLELICDYAYIRGFFRGRIQMIKALLEVGCKTQPIRDCDSAIKWLDELEGQLKKEKK